MKCYAPKYYKDFHCIADKCKESCCIGWEICIDDSSLERYSSTGGSLGKKLSDNIIRDGDGQACFKLTSDERCPFLCDNGLCELILSGGEEMLCHICHMHPRFVNLLPHRTETGIGLCCEEAARIILSADDCALEYYDDDEEYTIPFDEVAGTVFKEREELFEMLSADISCAQKAQTLIERGKLIDMIINGEEITQQREIGSHLIRDRLDEKIKLILSLEPLNDKWKAVCKKIKALSAEDVPEAYPEALSREYTNILHYYIYRFYYNRAVDICAFEGAAFAVLCADAAAIISAAAGMSITDSVCLWSKEAEYSEENTELIFEACHSIFI